MPTAIVLSGGGAKGDFEVGAVRCIYDRGIRPDIICGVSVGAINAVKLAEGENPGDPTQGLPGLEALWASLRRDSDMFVDADWLHDPDMDPMLADYLTGRSPRLGIAAPASPGPALGDVIGPVVEAIGGLAFLLGPGAGILKSLNVILQRAHSLFELSPISAKLGSNLDPRLVAAWGASGRHLRLGMVGLESGRLRYVTESGAVIETNGAAVPDAGPIAVACEPLANAVTAAREQLTTIQSELQRAAPGEKHTIASEVAQQRGAVADAEAALAECMRNSATRPLVVPLALGTLASASIPGVFHPVSLGGETYVDGGVREILPLQAAVDLGADTVYAISASRPDLPAAPTSYGSAGIFEIISRSLTEIVINEIAMTDFGVRPQAGRPLPQILNIHPDVDIHGLTTIDPGLIQINRDYGFMRAADVIDQVDSGSRRYRISTDIAMHRVQTWTLENTVAGQPDPLQPFTPSAPPRPDLQAQVDTDKQALAGLLAERRALGGAMPAGIDAFSGRPEPHPWLTSFNDARVVRVSPPAAGSVPGTQVAASVTMRNVGTTVWDAARAYALGSQQPQDNSIWGLGRVGLPGRVEPGAEVTFTFMVTVPPPPQALFAWQMVQDGVEWFGSPTVPVTVAVAEPARCGPIRQSISGNLADIRGLQQALDGLDPKNHADVTEIRQIRKQIGDLQAQNAALRTEAAGLGCVAIP